MIFPLCCIVVTCVRISWAGARGDRLSGDMCQRGCHRAWYQSTRLAVDYPSMETLALLFPDNDPMDLTRSILTGKAGVGQQFGTVEIVPISVPSKTSQILSGEAADLTQ